MTNTDSNCLELNLEDTFFSFFDDQKKYNGMTFSVIKQDEVEPEYGAIFFIKLENGEEIQAFKEEVCKGGCKEYFEKNGLTA